MLCLNPTVALRVLYNTGEGASSNLDTLNITPSILHDGLGLSGKKQKQLTFALSFVPADYCRAGLKPPRQTVCDTVFACDHVAAH